MCCEVPGRAPRAAARFGDVEAGTPAELGRPLAALVNGSKGGLRLAVQHWRVRTGVGRPNAPRVIRKQVEVGVAP